MNIQSITTDELRKMKDSEGLILQGCGGKLEEWVDGINELLTKGDILLDGSKFETCYSFRHDDLTCLFFPFEDNVKLDMGKLAMWRLQTHETFGGTWFSDYIPNRFGSFIEENQKPDCPLIGADGNIFNLMGIASRTLRRNGQSEQAAEMCERIRASDNYYKALGIIGEYVNITSVNEPEEEMEMC